MKLLGQFQTLYSFFYEKILHAPKAPKSTKKQEKYKKHPKHQKTQKKTQKRDQTKVQNANKQTRIKNVLKKHLSGKK